MLFSLKEVIRSLFKFYFPHKNVPAARKIQSIMIYSLFDFILNLSIHNTNNKSIENIINNNNNCVKSEQDENKQPSVETLCKFLDDLSSELKNNKLSPDSLLLLTEFGMKYKFIKNQCVSEDDSNMSDLLKFLSLGYHIYTNILPTT